MWTVAIYSEKNMNHIDKICGQNSDLVSGKAGCIYDYYSAIKD